MKEFCVTKRDPQTGLVSIEIDKTTKTIENIQNLVQRITKLLLTTPGIDIFSPELGSGIKVIQKKPIGQSNIESTKRQLSINIMQVKEQILNNQFDTKLSNEEKLQDMYITNLDYDFEQGIWNITIRVISMAGESLDLSFLRQ